MNQNGDNSSPAIELSDVRLVYEDGDEPVVALDGIWFRVEPGERVAIIGPSGSGKSSLMRVLGGMESVNSGDVRVSGRNLAAGPGGRDAARDVGHVFQEFGLVSELTALQNVLCGRLFDYRAHETIFGFSEADRRRAAGHLKRLGLGDRLHQRTSKLSGGEKQRVGIARLLAQSPELVLLDEPVSNLDVHWAAEAMGQLDSVRAGDVTVVAVLHNLAAVRSWADRVVLMRDGAIVYDGDPETACRRLESLEPAELTESANSPSECDSGSDPESPKSAPGRMTSDDLDRPGLERGLYYGLAFAALVAAWIWSIFGLDIGLWDLFGRLGGAGEFFGRLIPPDFSVTETAVDSLVETVQMALVGTSLAAVISLPLSALAARNVSPGPIRAVARVILNLLRTIPSIIWGLFFVAMVGLGPVPGILALTFYASGYLGKFYYEGIESISIEPVRALRTMGASRLQQFRHGVFPQVLPLLVGYTLYMFEYNVRAASILGIVGAGGIGFYLRTWIQTFQYSKATTALLLLLVVVTVIDAASSQIRRRLSD